MGASSGTAQSPEKRKADCSVVTSAGSDARCTAEFGRTGSRRRLTAPLARRQRRALPWGPRGARRATAAQLLLISQAHPASIQLARDRPAGRPGRPVRGRRLKAAPRAVASRKRPPGAIAGDAACGHALFVGTWGAGLWSDDTACDVRITYRNALEDGLSDEQANELVLTDFAPDLADEDEAPVVWLALAVCQHERGRLTAEVRDRALEVIDTGADLRRWEHLGPRERGRRAAVLTRVRARLMRPQPPRKPVRRRPRHVTTLKPGDILAYRAPSGRFHLLAVRVLDENRYGAFPIVRLLDYHEERLPGPGQLAELRDQPRGRSAGQNRPVEPWWTVDGLVGHTRGHDFTDSGFQVIGHVPAPSQADQRRLLSSTSSSSGWKFWQGYLRRQDELLGERLAAGPNAPPSG